MEEGAKAVEKKLETMKKRLEEKNREFEATQELAEAK